MTNYLKIYWTDFDDFFSPFDRYLIVDYRFHPRFPTTLEMLPTCQGNQLATAPLFGILEFRNALGNRNSDLRRLNADDPAIHSLEV